MDTQQYLRNVEARLAEGGFAVTPHADLGGGTACVGHRSEFTWLAMSRMHLFFCVEAVDTVTSGGLEEFAQRAVGYANAQKGALRGLQSGLAVVPVQIGAAVQEDARHFAQHQLVRKFAAFAWPVAVDATQEVAYRHLGRPTIGAAFTGWMRRQVDAITLEPVPA